MKPAGWTASVGSTHYIGETEDGLDRRFREDLKLGLLHELSGATLSKFVSLSQANGLSKPQCKLYMFMKGYNVNIKVLLYFIACTCESATRQGCIHSCIG
jgi:hypothetical protein